MFLSIERVRPLTINNLMGLISLTINTGVVTSSSNRAFKKADSSKNSVLTILHLLFLGVFDTLPDSIQCLNFAKKIIHSIFDSILLYPRFNSKYYSIQKNSADSIQKIIQFISQGIIDTGRMGKVPKNYLKNVQNRLKKGLFIKNGKYRFKI